MRSRQMPRRVLAATAATTLLAALLVPTVANAITVASGANDLPITQVVLNDNGSTVTQNASASGVTDFTANPVSFVSVTIDDGGPITLNHFNVVGTTPQNFNFPGGLTGVNALENGVATPHGDAGFEAAVGRVLSSLDLRDYLTYDALNMDATTWNPDFDFMLEAPLRNDDYLIVTERNGNTFFDLIPLDKAGNVIAGSEVVGFDAAYRWNTGYAPSDNTTQPQWMSVVDIEIFNVDTYEEPIYGFRIDNDGEADVKFFALDDEPFLTDIVLEKTVYEGHDSGVSCSAGDLASVSFGASITYCFEITNGGEAPLDNVTITDAQLGLTNATTGSFTVVSGTTPINSGQTLMLAYETTASATVTNSATVSADVLNRDTSVNTTLSPATDTDTADVVVSGAAPASISGTVVDELGNGISGVTISLSGTESDTTTTLGDGTWTFAGLSPGTYTGTETQPSTHGDGSETVGTAGGTGR